MLQADVCNSTHMCEFCTLRDLNGACEALQPQGWSFSKSRGEGLVSCLWLNKGCAAKIKRVWRTHN